MDKTKYLLAKANGLLDKFRSDEISRRITKEVPLSEQIAIAMDINEKPEKHKRYQALRASKIQEVDAEIAEIEAQL